MENKIKNSTLIRVIIIAVATFIGMSHNIVYGQSVPTNNTMQQHTNHSIDNLIISQHIPLTGNLVKGDYILLMDLTPFATSVEEHSHIAMKIPCNEDGSPKATLVTGIAPNLKSLDVGKAINNGTLNGKSLDLSDEGNSCLYHSHLPTGITDIALVNTSNETLNFDRGGYTLTVTVHGSAMQHLAANETGK
jgi:hypothetical protein